MTQKEMNSAILNSIGEAVIIVDPDGRIIRNCNSVTEKLFGYNKDELIGKKTSILHISQEHYDKFGEESEYMLDQRGTFKGEFKMQQKNGKIIETYHTISALQKEAGWENGVVSVIKDITDKKQTERQLQSHKKERSILLAEIHHRVKNNLAIIAGLLYMQIESSVNEHVIESLKTSYCRLQSIAQVHEQLYKDAEIDANISLCSYLHKMAESIDSIIVLHDKTIKIDINCESVTIPLIQAVPLGLIISELLVNAYKHAFVNKKEGHIQIIADQNKEQLMIEITDDGVGLPEDFSSDNTSIGFNIIQSLTEQLEGNFSYSTQPEIGTSFSVSFTVKN